MIIGEFTLNAFDTIGGKRYLFNTDTPDVRFAVSSLLDSSGDETEDEDLAVGGVVEIGEEQFMVFYFNQTD